MTNNLKIPIAELFLISEERINIQTSDGWTVYFNPKGDISWQITELSLVLAKQIPPEKRGELDYIDLRFSRIYFKYK